MLYFRSLSDSEVCVCRGGKTAVSHPYFHRTQEQKKKIVRVSSFSTSALSEWLLFNVNSAVFKLHHGESTCASLMIKLSLNPKIRLIDWLIDLCFTPILVVFQLYRGALRLDMTVRQEGLDKKLTSLAFDIVWILCRCFRPCFYLNMIFF